jgi:hypothetical protein
MRTTKARRHVFLFAGVLIVWGSLGYRFIKYPDPMDRMLAVFVLLGVTLLAVFIRRGPLLPKSGGWDEGGGNADPGNHDSHGTHESHSQDHGGGHGGFDGSDGGSH